MIEKIKEMETFLKYFIDFRCHGLHSEPGEDRILRRERGIWPSVLLLNRNAYDQPPQFASHVETGVPRHDLPLGSYGTRAQSS